MDKIPVVLLVAMSMAVNLIGSIFRKIYTTKTENKFIWQYFFVGLTSLTALLTFLAWGGAADVRAGNLSNTTLWIGLLYGVIMAVQLVLYMLAVGSGSFSYTVMIVSLGALLPGLSGAIFWGEKLGICQIIGIVLMVIALCFSAGKDAEKKKPSAAWLIFVFLAFIFAAGVGLVQKWHQETEFKAEINGFLIAAFLSATISMFLIFFIGLFADKAKAAKLAGSPVKISMPFGALFVILICIAGIFIAVNNKFNLYLSGKLDSIIFFPLVNGGAMVLNTVSSLVIFREKLTFRMWIGLILGTVAMVLVCLPY